MRSNNIITNILRSNNNILRSNNKYIMRNNIITYNKYIKK